MNSNYKTYTGEFIYDSEPVETMFQVAELKVSYYQNRHIARPKVNQSADAFTAMRQVWSGWVGWREEMYLLALNRAHEVIGFFKVSEGSISGTLADPKIIFGVALGCQACYIILAHNHPSGCLEPSPADLDLTRKLRECGKLLDCPLLDHLIVTPDETYLSFADHGILN